MSNLSDGTGSGNTPPANDGQPKDGGSQTTPPGGAQQDNPAPDAGQDKPSGGTKGTLSDLQSPDQGQADSVDNLPEWAQKLIKELRGENASHRKAKKQAEEEAEVASRKAAEEQGKFKELYEKELAKREEAEAEVKQLALDALKSKVASEVGLPQQLASRLAGETEDEIKADAQAVLAALPKHTLDNDAGRGTGGPGTQTPQMSEEEIKEFAARMGVDPRYVKPEHFKVAKK
jgi:hypothetical protein